MQSTWAPPRWAREFTAGGIAALFADGAADAPVTALWAGTVCVFR